jgi:hypothetical protein
MSEMTITVSMPKLTNEELCHLEELEPCQEVPQFSLPSVPQFSMSSTNIEHIFYMQCPSRAAKIKWFVKYFNDKHLSSMKIHQDSNLHCMKVQMGSIFYKGEMQPIEVSVASPSDIDIDGMEVWVNIGGKYPRIPMLEQYNDPIRMDNSEVIPFVQKVYNRVTLGYPNFFELEKNDSDDESDDESDNESDDE